MFYLLFIFYWTSIANSFSYTLDGVIQLGPDWEYKFNIGSPENGDRPSGRTAFQRSSTSESDVSFSTEEETVIKKRATEEFIRTTSTTTTKASSERFKISTKHDERAVIYQKASHSHIPDDDFDDEEHHREPKKKYDRADSDDGDTILSSNEEDASFPKGFTQPLRENENNYDATTKRKKKSPHTTKTVLQEKKKNKKRHKTKESEANVKPQSNINHIRYKKIVKYEDSQIDDNENPLDTSHVYKQPERIFDPFGNGKSIINDWKNAILNTFKKNNTKTISNKVNKTRNFIEIRIDVSPKDNYRSKLLSNENFNDFYSTPAMWTPSDPKMTPEVAKFLRNSPNEEKDIKVELDNLFQAQDSQRIRDNDTINSFTKQILENTLKLFDGMREKTTEYRWKKKMKILARSYEERFKEFLRATKQHTIRTRLGIRKVILNAIHVSRQIVSRLVNFMADDMEKRRLVYNNSTLVMFRSEIEKVEMNELERACKKLGICKVQKGFTEFLTDMLLKMLKVQNEKFKLAFDSMVESARKTDFALSETVAEGIRKKIDYCGRQNVNVQKGMMVIVKNMIVNRNTPLVLYNDTNPSERKLHSTLAFLEIINTLDEKVPSDDNNVHEWESMSREMDGWVQGSNVNVQSIMTRFMSHLSNVIKEIDSNSWDIILRNAEILFL